MYLRAQGIPQDYKEAFRWFRHAAEQGEGIAQMNLGLMYFKGLGVVQDYKESANWYWFAADQGIPSAQAKLGMMYEYGHGVFQDYVSAYMWYSLGALQGHKVAREHRDILKKKSSPSQIEVAQQLAREWLVKHRGISMFLP